MHRYIVTIPLPWGGSYSLPSYGFMILCGFLLSWYIVGRRARRAGINPDDMLDVATALLMGGIVGSRMFFVLQNWPHFRANLLDIVRIDKGGLVFYGGLMGGAAAFLLVALKKKLPLRRTLDLLASVVPLGHAFGRIGCFLNGCCFGKVTGSWVGVCFPKVLAPGSVTDDLLNVGKQHIAGSPAFEWHLGQGLIGPNAECSLRVHPTQLYAVGYNLLIFAAVSYFLWRRWREGDVMYLYFALYGSARFVNEFFRVNPPVLAGLSIAQVICVPLALFGLAMLVRDFRRPRQPLAQSWQPPLEAGRR